MNTADVVAYRAPGAGPDTTVSARVLGRIAASVPESTRQAYASDWKIFAEWCAGTGRSALPCTAETLAEYASHLADENKAPATIMRAVSSVRVIHKLGGHPPPDTLPARSVVKTYRNERADQGQPNERPAAALTVRQLKAITEALDGDSVLFLRDRLILVLGWAMMARRSELVRLSIGDLAEVEQGMDVTIRKAKRDQMAAGRKVAVPYGSDPLTCPVRLTRAWLAVLAARSITSGPLLRYVDRHGHIYGEPGVELAGRAAADGRLTGKAIGSIMHRAALTAGISGDAIRAHSLRAGGATGAYLGGADLLSIGRHGGWRDGSPVLMKYVRDVDRWKKNPMTSAGL